MILAVNFLVEQRRDKHYFDNSNAYASKIGFIIWLWLRSTRGIKLAFFYFERLGLIISSSTTTTKHLLSYWRIFVQGIYGWWNKRGFLCSTNRPISAAREVCSVLVPLNSTAYLARFQASSGNSDSANRPGYEAELDSLIQILKFAKIFEKMMSRPEYEIFETKALQLYFI